MQFFDSIERVPHDFGPSAVTFGKFDGVHAGHRAVIRAVREIASDRGLVTTVVTFDRNPLSILAPDRCPPSLVSNVQKRELLERAGVEAMVEIPFDREFSNRTALDFVDRVLVGALRAEVVLVGPDTRFGAGGAGDFDTLVELGASRGFEVRRLEVVSDDNATPSSSTRVRQLLADGDVRGASKMLERHPSVRAMVVHGERRGRDLGYPTANLSPDLEGYIPADGVYAGYLTSDGRRMPAAISVGNNPTFEGVPAKRVEAYVIDSFVFDDDLDLYDLVVEVEFVDRVRGMEKFDSLDALIAQMGDDVERARGVLGMTQPTP